MQPTNTFGSFLVAALSASMAAGLAVPSSGKPGSFELKQTRSAIPVAKNPWKGLVRMHMKYGHSVPQGLIEASERWSKSLTKRAGSGSVVATDAQDDEEYYIPVSIGSNGQKLNLDLDTGSSDLWVFQPSTPGADGHNVYDATKSKTAKKLKGASWSIGYGDGSSSSGQVYTDSVTIGGLTVQGQAVETAQQASSEFVNGPSDGLIGLAMSQINTVSPQKQTTWFDNISDSLDSALFTADLRYHKAGTYTFGAIPPEASNIAWADLNPENGFWQFSTGDGQNNFDAIADTGTTAIALDPDTVSNYYSNVDGAQFIEQGQSWVFNCNAQLDDYSYVVGDTTFTVPGSSINLGQADPQDPSICLGGLQPIPPPPPGGEPLPFNIFGDVAMKVAYVVFDKGNSRVGWAPKSL